MARSLSGEISVEEQKELQRLFISTPSLQDKFEVLKAINNNHVEGESIADEAKKVSRIFQLAEVDSVMNKPLKNRKIISFNTFKYAAAAILIVAISVIFLQRKHSSETKQENVVAKNGSRTRTILPDGSTVWLNAGSKIFYDIDFTKATREVTLDGEAFFDVVKQPQRPFIVHAGKIDIKVLGTAFNVKSYAEDSTVETTLLRGLVQVTNSADKKSMPVYLHPNQKLVIDKNNIQQNNNENVLVAKEINSSLQKTIITKIDSAIKESDRIETSWVYNRLIFKGDDFNDLAKKLERWYNVTIHFEDEKVQNLTFNGSLENETAEQAFAALQKAVPSFNYSINNHEIFIRTSK
jgi:ferric-dicitrate binding protein FerR (iron transport regulator)